MDGPPKKRIVELRSEILNLVGRKVAQRSDKDKQASLTSSSNYRVINFDITQWRPFMLCDVESIEIRSRRSAY